MSFPKFSEKAFKCSECPQKAGDDGCPVWWSIVQDNPQTGETRIQQNCGFVIMPMFFTETIKASNRPAQHISQMRNDIVGAINGANMKNSIRQVIKE